MCYPKLHLDSPMPCLLPANTQYCFLQSQAVRPLANQSPRHGGLFSRPLCIMQHRAAYAHNTLLGSALLPKDSSTVQQEL